MNSIAKILDQNNELVITFLSFLLANEFILYIKIRTTQRIVEKANNFNLPVFLGTRMKTTLHPGEL